MSISSLNLFNQLPGCWGCKDTNSRYIQVNAEYAQLFDYNSPEDFCGRTDYDLPGARSHFAKDFQAQDQTVMRTGKQMRVLNIHLDKNKQEWRAHLFTKSPWRDEEGQIRGVIFSGMELRNTAILKVGHLICRALEPHKTPVCEVPDFEPPVLTEREKEVMFFLLYGKKQLYIAQALNLSPKTIEKYVSEMRDKFHTKYTDKMLEYAIALGYNAKFPNSLITKPMSIVLED